MKTKKEIRNDVLKRYRSTEKGHLIRKLGSMKERCYNKNNKSYMNYGGRGITICNEWLDDSNKFYIWSINNGYKRELQIDRINNNSNYSPANCRFVTKEVNLRNRSNIVTDFKNKMRICSVCREKLTLDSFCRDKSRIFKVNYICKKCVNNKHKKKVYAK